MTMTTDPSNMPLAVTAADIATTMATDARTGPTTGAGAGTSLGNYTSTTSTTVANATANDLCDNKGHLQPGAASTSSTQGGFNSPVMRRVSPSPSPASAKGIATTASIATTVVVDAALATATAVGTDSSTLPPHLSSTLSSSSKEEAAQAIDSSSGDDGRDGDGGGPHEEGEEALRNATMSMCASDASSVAASPSASATVLLAAAALADRHMSSSHMNTNNNNNNNNNANYNDNNNNNNNNVDKVVAKSKRAATFLWMLLHAQSCRSPPLEFLETARANDVTSHSHCPHNGCLQVKRLLLHVRNCPAYNNASSPCPTNYQGCQDSRKLLTHYRSCREKAKMYRKQSRLISKTKGAQQKQQQQTNFCLICTLLAKHDKDVSGQMKLKQQQQHQQILQKFECQSIPLSSTTTTTTSSSPLSTLSSLSSPSLSPYIGTGTGTQHHSRGFTTPNGGYSKTVQFDLNPTTTPTTTAHVHTHTTSTTSTSESMPPPPPRSRTASIGSLTSLLKATKVKTKRSINRPRATSLDEKRLTLSTLSTIAFAMNDPTVELELKQPTYRSSSTFDTSHLHGHDHGGSGGGSGSGSSIHNAVAARAETSVVTLPFRKRSVSCSMVYDYNSTSQDSRQCETIMEE